MKKIIFIFLSVFGLSSVHAQVADFTEKEIADHQSNIGTIVQVAANCLDSVYADHIDFFEDYGVSKYYGERKWIKGEKPGQRPDGVTLYPILPELRRLGFTAARSVELQAQMENTSCIGLALRCLGQGFYSIGMNTTWDKIITELKIDNKVFGSDLQKNLMKLGWKSYYWNPNPSLNAVWDADDMTLNPLKPGKAWNSVWGGHAYRYNQAVNKGYYFEKDLYVHDATSLVGFGDVQPAFFKDIPFFVGIAHAGYHVFPGRSGEVIEAHSVRDLNARDNLEFSEFNPLKKGGGPKWTPKEKYRSGLIVVPY